MLIVYCVLFVVRCLSWRRRAAPRRSRSGMSRTPPTGRGAARTEDAQGTPTQSHVSPSILVYEDTPPPASLAPPPPACRLIVYCLLFVVYCLLKRGSGFRVQGLGFRFQGIGFRIQGLPVQGLGCRVQGSGFRVEGFRV